MFQEVFGVLTLFRLHLHSTHPRWRLHDKSEQLRPGLRRRLPSGVGVRRLLPGRSQDLSALSDGDLWIVHGCAGTSILAAVISVCHLDLRLRRLDL